jgi:hypothetical protein
LSTGGMDLAISSTSSSIANILFTACVKHFLI